MLFSFGKLVKSVFFFYCHAHVNQSSLKGTGRQILLPLLTRLNTKNTGLTPSDQMAARIGFSLPGPSREMVTDNGWMDERVKIDSEWGWSTDTILG